VFDHGEMHVVLNLAVGGDGGDPAGTAFPQVMAVDYLRAHSGVPYPPTAP
jgi:hypothetical protein